MEKNILSIHSIKKSLSECLGTHQDANQSDFVCNNKSLVLVILTLISLKINVLNLSFVDEKKKIIRMRNISKMVDLPHVLL